MKTLRPSILIATAAVVATTLAAPPTLARDAALAESLFREARALMKEGDYVNACPKLAESQAQDPATGTLLALAVCLERSGRTASAWATYSEAASRAAQEGRKDREQAARERIAELEPRLSLLTIEVAPEVASLAGLEVKRDGIVVGEAAWGTAAPVDPGEHVIEVTAPGKSPWVQRATLTDVGDRQSVVVPGLADEPREKASPEAEPTTLAPKDARADESARPSTLRTTGWIVGGVGVLSLGVGGVFTGLAVIANDESKADGQCDEASSCSGTGFVKRQQAQDAATVATVGFIAGGVLTAAGVTLLLFGNGDANVQATAQLGPRLASVHVTGRF